MLRRTLVLFLFIISTTIFAASPTVKKNKADFQQGVTYFKAKDYKAAIGSFLRARKNGMKKVALTFNIATTYYHLEQFSNSEKEFKKLTRTKSFKHIAYYNLGLIAEKQGNKKLAISYYKKTKVNNKNTRLVKLADSRIRKLTGSSAKTIASVSIGFGSDDNVTRAVADSPSNTQDNVFELYGFVKTPLSKDMNFKGTYYQNNYSTLSTENFSFFSFALDYPVKLKDWTVTPELGFINSTLNGAGYQSILDLKVTGKTRLSKESRLALRYRLSNISSQNATYNYLDGQRHQLRADYKRKTFLGRLRLRYQLEINNRQNLPSENHSPMRNTIRVRLKQKVNSNWSLAEEFGFRNSKYGSAAGISRNDNRTRLRLSAERKFNKDWTGAITYTSDSNSSNVAAETYKRNRYMLYAIWNY